MISQDRQIRVDYERRRMAYHDAISLRRDSWVEGHEEGKRLGVGEGKRLGQQALAEALISVLQARGLPLSNELRARIDAETDLARLKGWVTRAALAASAEEVLSG